MKKKKKAIYQEIAYFYECYCFNYYPVLFFLGPTGTGKTWVNSVRKSMSHKNKQ